VLNQVQYAATNSLPMIEPATLCVVQRNSEGIIPVPVERSCSTALWWIATQSNPDFAYRAPADNFSHYVGDRGTLHGRPFRAFQIVVFRVLVEKAVDRVDSLHSKRSVGEKKKAPLQAAPFVKPSDFVEIKPDYPVSSSREIEPGV
jgi:hypothetical protein